jgi:hypothetical protein
MKVTTTMSRVFKIGVVFEIHPDTDHADMFTDENDEHYTPSNDEVVERGKSLVFEDISSLVYRGELWDSMSVEVENV